MKKSSAVACFLAWLIPGTGHFYVGQKLKGAVLFMLILGLFLAGLIMKGGIVSVHTDFISRLCMAGRVGIGLPWLVTLFTDLKTGDMLSPFGEIGACCTTVAGLLNFLVVLRIDDLIKKENYIEHNK